MSKAETKKQPAGACGCATRRTFVRAALGGAGVCYAAAIGYPVYRYLASPVEKSAALGAVKEVTLKGAQKLPLGSAMIFRFGARPGVLIHHKDDQWVAMSAKCTHLGCTVQYEAAKDRIYCACHGGVYNARTGANVSGPPPRPLEQFRAKVDGSDVIVSRA